MKISGYIITFNEEHNIIDCIKSLGVCDEIMVVDSSSTDRTISRVKEYARKNKNIPIKIINKTFSGFVDQKNFAMKKTIHEWVLNLDADERISPELYQSILKIKKSFPEGKTDNITSFSMNRRNFYIDTWVNHSGWYPDKKIRLFLKNSGGWRGEMLHESVFIKSGKTLHLKGDIVHYSIVNIADHILRIDKYTSIAAEALFKKGKKVSIPIVFFRMITTFLRSYIWKFGFLDGSTGFIISVMAAYYTWLKYLKLWYLQRENTEKSV